MKQLPGLTPAWLICLALVLGVTIVVLVPAAISQGDTIKANDWIGFAGNIVGAIVTLIAAIIAWFAVQQQIKAQDRNAELARTFETEKLRQNHAEAKFAAVAVLTQSIHAVTAVAMLNSKILKLIDAPNNQGLQGVGISAEITLAFANMQTAFDQLKEVLRFFGVSEAWRDLEVNDKAIYLTITSTLQTLLNLHDRPLPNHDRERAVRVRDRALRNLQGYIRAFDADLGESFDRDAGL